MVQAKQSQDNLSQIEKMEKYSSLHFSSQDHDDIAIALIEQDTRTTMEI